MVYDLRGGPPKPEFQVYMESADRWLNCANDIMKHFPEISFYMARHAVELAFKSTLLRFNISIDEFESGKKGHNIQAMKLRLIESGHLSTSFFPQEIREPLNRTSHTDVAHPEIEGDKLIDEDTGGISALRYPIKGYGLYNSVTSEQVKQQLTDSKNLIAHLKTALPKK